MLKPRTVGCGYVAGVTCVVAVIAMVVIVAAGAVTLIAVNHNRPTSGPPSAFTPKQLVVDRPLVLTYYFYWYDAATGSHLGPNAPLPVHPVDQPTPSYRSVAWHKKELTDMAQAGIDVAMPVYWGFGKEAWSTDGLAYMSQARDELLAQKLPAPALGLFLDTSILKGRDLTRPENIDFFYANVSDFYHHVPTKHWARVNGRPIVWIWGPQPGNNVGQELFDQTYQRFQAEFGVRPFIVRDLGFNCPITGWRNDLPVQDCRHPIQTDASYVWGTAERGYDPLGEVASVGPGYDERLVPGRAGLHRSRDGGKWYISNFDKAIASGKQLLVLETWNEFHEATAVCETKEYGRQYIELSKQLTDRWRAAVTKK